MFSEDETPPGEIFDPEATYTPEEKKRMRATAQKAATAEWRSDPNRRDPKGTQGRMDEAVHGLRVQMGLEKG